MEKHEMIRQALETEEGREALGTAVEDPICISLEYQSAPRRMLRFRKFGRILIAGTPARRTIKREVEMPDDLMKFECVDRMQVEIKDHLLQAEEGLFLAMLREAAEGHIRWCDSERSLVKHIDLTQYVENLDEALDVLEGEPEGPSLLRTGMMGHILMSEPSIVAAQHDERYDDTCQRDKLMTRTFGHLGNLSIKHVFHEDGGIQLDEIFVIEHDPREDIFAGEFMLLDTDGSVRIEEKSRIVNAREETVETIVMEVTEKFLMMITDTSRVRRIVMSDPPTEGRFSESMNAMTWKE